MKASFLVTAVAPSILAIAATWGFPASVTAEDKFGPWGPPVNLGPTINSIYSNERPAISRDNLSLYFDSDRPGFGGSDIWVSQRTSADDPWGTPQNLGPTVNSAAGEFSPNLSPNGHWLFFGSNRLGGGCGGIDIWASHRTDRDDDFAWEPPVNLGCVLNTSANDDFPFLFVDKEQDTTVLYFASDRDYGSTNYHIYASTMNEEDGTFGPGVLVRELNCFPPDCVVQRDSRTTIRRDGLEIILGSWNRPGGFGKQDLWVSTRKDTEDPWSKPVNLGPMVNTSNNEGGPALSRDGTTLYFHSDRLGPPNHLQLYVTRRAKLHEQETEGESGHQHH